MLLITGSERAGSALELRKDLFSCKEMTLEFVG
jgi:hypothetical protein